MVPFRVDALLLVALLAMPPSSALAGPSALYDLLIADADDVLDLLPIEEEGALPIADPEGPSERLSSVVFGTPSLVSTVNGQAMRLDAEKAGRFYEQVRLDLGVLRDTKPAGASCGDVRDPASLFIEDDASEYSGYSIDLEFMINRLSFFGPNKDFSVFFDGTSALARLDFTPDGKVVLYDGAPEIQVLGDYPMGEALSLHAEVDLVGPSLSLMLNDEEILFDESQDFGRDLRALRLSLGLGHAVPAPSVMIHDVYVESFE